MGRRFFPVSCLSPSESKPPYVSVSPDILCRMGGLSSFFLFSMREDVTGIRISIRPFFRENGGTTGEIGWNF